MDKKLKAKWIAALRSGKFRQAQGQLIKGHDSKPSYCCLGVLEHICGTPKAILRANERNLSVGEHRGVTLLMRRNLAVMNDEPTSFGVIAKYIEKNL